MKKIVICGAGNNGKELWGFLDYLLQENENLGTVSCFVDSNSQIKEIDKIPVLQPEFLDKITDDENSEEYLFIITPADGEAREFYKNKLIKKNYVIYNGLDRLNEFLDIDLTTLNRAGCAFGHINNMDNYFERAESHAMLKRFWGNDSPFRYYFNNLDLDNVIELACGHGRHVTQYIDKAKKITLVDILQKNIDICQKRYLEHSQITFYKNNGYNLSKLPSNSYTSLFCYDAMVHFELLDINSYLIDIFRVLKDGGKVLLHHSNLDAFYRGSFLNHSLHGRAFMNYKIFAHLAIHAGFNVLEQKIIDWRGIPNLDCITFLEKPKTV